MATWRTGNLCVGSTLFAIILMTCGCAHKAMAPPPPPPPETILGDDSAGLQQSLFKGDQAVLSDQDIARILGTQIKLSDMDAAMDMLSSEIGQGAEYPEDLAGLEANEGTFRIDQQTDQIFT